MSVIKRLGNLAKGTLKTWGDDDDAPLTNPERAAAEAELRRLEDEARALNGRAPASPEEPGQATPSDPLEARRAAIERAHAAGVLTDDEREEKLKAVSDEEQARERGLPPKPRKRTL